MKSKSVIMLSLALVLSGCSSPKQPDAVKSGMEPASAAAAGSVVQIYNDTADAVKEMALQTQTSGTFSMKDHVVYSGPRTEKKVALTFDDGPDSKYTGQILDILKKSNVVATFFVTGEHASAHKDVMKRIVENRHEVGNHSWDHVDLTKLDSLRIQEEIDRTDDIVKTVTGQPVSLFRAPYAALSQPVVEYAEKSHRIIGWSVDTRDWEGVSPEKIMQTVKKQLKPGAIILQHCAGGKNGNLSNTVKALPELIAYLKEQGYQMVTVSELLSRN